MGEFDPSLTIGFASNPTSAVLRTPDRHGDELSRLGARFRTGSQRDHLAVEIEIDDLLSNLDKLTSWSQPETVHWDPALRELATGVVLDAHSVKQQLERSEAGTEQIELEPSSVPGLLGADWIAPLTDFQCRDIAKLLRLRHGANFSVPGAGKTRVALAVFAAMKNTSDVRRLLIVSPKSAYESWQAENLLCFAEPLHMQVVSGQPDSSVEALVVNYERLDRSTTALARWLGAEPSMMVLDEAHRMKLGVDGVYGAACLALGPRARRRLILTGTPAPNGARDLENLMGFVWPGHGRQTVARAVAGGDLPRASKALQPLFTRTTKKELNLPPVDLRVREVDLPPLHREIYDALAGHFSARAAAVREDFDALGRILMYLLMAATSPALLATGSTRYEPLAFQVPPLELPQGSLLELMRDLPGYEMSPKYGETQAVVAANAAAGRKTLVWSTFIRSLNTLRDMLADFNPAVVHGGVEDRDDQIRRFRDDPDCMVLLSNPATLGEGISLHQVCHDAVYVDRDFAAGRFLQSADRIHRLGLASDVETRIVVLSSTGTIDEVVANRLAAKLEFMGGILNDPAVQALADLQQEPAAFTDIDERDRGALMEHLGVVSPS
jgi:SNF2 family DNA or RNA helicase